MHSLENDEVRKEIQGNGGEDRKKEKNVRINGVMIKILIETRTKWECAEAAGSSNFNMGFLSSILQGFSSLPVLFPRSVHITAFCHPSLLEL